MYLRETDVKDLLKMIYQKLGTYEIVCEVSNSYWIGKMKSRYMQWKFKHQLGMSSGAIFTFGIPNSQYFEKWSTDYRFLDEWTYFDDNEKN